MRPLVVNAKGDFAEKIKIIRKFVAEGLGRACRGAVWPRENSSLIGTIFFRNGTWRGKILSRKTSRGDLPRASGARLAARKLVSIRTMFFEVGLGEKKGKLTCEVGSVQPTGARVIVAKPSSEDM